MPYNSTLSVSIVISFTDSLYYFLHYGDIHTGKKSFININKEWKTIPKTDLDAEKISTSYYLNDADIVFADASEDYEGIGKSITIINETKLPFIAGLHTIIAKDKTDLVYRDYKRYFMLNHNVRKQFMFYATGISVLGISMNNIKKIIVSLPSKKEQQKIAQILSTWDEAIELKEKLIEEKQEQKRGLMQKLLTGNFRLPGFEGEWEEVRLKQLLNYEQPNNYITNNIIDYQEGKIPVLTANKSFILGSTLDKKGICEKVPVIIFDDFTTDTKYVDFPFKIKSSAIKILREKSNYVDLRFIYERVQLIKYPLGAHKRYYISEYQYYKINLPSIQEQKAIADILSTADKEIELLTQELELLKLQKKGLMQLLLTGMVRVPIE
jgi:type I restriction enzyme S subunit